MSEQKKPYQHLSIEQCKNLINTAESIGWKPEITKLHNYKVVTFEVNDEIKDIITSYCENNLNLEIKKVNVGIMKYEKDCFFERHIDRYSESESNHDFLYNINVRLNDDYKGGEFYLNDSPYQKPVGEIYHYKSTEYHEVKRITEGIRYTAIFYIRERDVIKDKSKKNFL
jgi:predicted 2-oxoglutarate/Fe(II)-dependent dioxygenase YbiX